MGWRPAVGSCVVWHNQAVSLLPGFYISNALLVSGLVQEQANWRAAALHAHVWCIAAEVLWTALHPGALSPRLSGLALLGAVGLNFLQLCSLYGLTLEFSSDTLLAINLLRGVLLIPASQFGSAWVLSQGVERSQARWRICGWITTILLGLLVLMFPEVAAGPMIVVATVSLPSVLVALVLFGQPPPEYSTGAVARSDVHRVSTDRAAMFVLGACCLGTNGEGLMDSAVGLTVRRALAEGRSQLAISNQTAVLVSMLLALVSETSFLQGSASQRGALFITLWLIVNLARVVGLYMNMFSDDATGAIVVWVFVLLDKYTGPLGNAALEVALLRVLGPLNKGSGVSATLLLTLRMTTEAVCRPLAELLLLAPDGGLGLGEHWVVRMELVVVVLVVGTAVFVMWHLRDGFARIETRRLKEE